MFNVPVKKDNEITIATINVRTLKDDIKLGSTFEVFQSLQHDILFMKETRRLGKILQIKMVADLFGKDINGNM